MKIKDAYIKLKKIPLMQAINYEQPNPYIVNTKIMESGKHPVLTPGKSFIKGYTDEEDGLYTKTPVIIFDDFTTAIKYVDFDFKVKSSAMKILKPRDSNVNLKYIFYQMSLVKINASTHKRYYISKYQNQPFLFPFKGDSLDIETQNYLVDEIETQFTRLDAAIKSLRAIKSRLGYYRYCVLKAAVEGRFFASQVRFVEKQVSELSKIKGGKRLPKGNRLHGEETPHPYIRVVDFDNYSVNKSSLKYIARNVHEKISRYIIGKNDVFISIAGTIGRVGMIPEELDGANLTENAARLTDIRNVLPKYLMYYLASPKARELIAFSTKSTSQPKLALFRIGNLIIRFPKDIKYQQEVVEKIESRFLVIDKVGEIVDNALKKTERLRKSILKAAFEDKLVKEEKVMIYE